MVGTWSEPEQHLTVQFKQDGTFLQTSTHGKLSVIYSGHYNVSGNHLHCRFEDVSLKGVPAAVQQRLKDNMPTVVGTENESNVELVTPDRMNITRGAVMETFDRVKGA